MKKSQLGINSVSTKGTLEEKLFAYHRAGFTQVEFVLSDVKDYLQRGHSTADVQKLLEENQLSCIGGFECGVEAFSTSEARASNQALLVENAKLLGQLGATTMVVGTDGPPQGSTLDAESIIEEIAQAFSVVAKKIAASGVTLCIEFNWSPVVKSLRTAAEIAQRANELGGVSNVGVLFDPAHYHCTPTKFEELSTENIALIKHVHVDDMADKPGELSNCNSDRVLPGQGILDLPALFGRIESAGYRGNFSIEMFSDELWSLPSEAAAQRMMKSLLPLCEDGS